MDAVNSQLMRGNNSSMPISNSSKTTVTKGRQPSFQSNPFVALLTIKELNYGKCKYQEVSPRQKNSSGSNSTGMRTIDLTPASPRWLQH